MSERPRYLALDVFRGMTVCFMIIVNSPGSWHIAYPPLLHASWHGFTPTDLVFPSFLFAVGNAMAFVMPKYESLGTEVFWKKTIKRTVIIFVLGYLMYWFPFVQVAEGGLELKPINETRILGVLQRIALCYFFASFILFYGSRNFAIWFSLFTMAGYWILLYVFGDANDPYSMLGNFGTELDLLILGEKHMYHGEGVAFEPEGLLSTWPSIVNVIAGFMVGDYIRRNKSTYETIAKLLIAGALMIFTALVWDMVFPINKKLWTSSFVLLTVGLGTVVLAMLMYVIDIKKNQRWTYFFEVFGRNPLFIYLLSEIGLILLLMIPSRAYNVRTWLYEDFFGSIAGPALSSFLFAFFFMLLCWLMGYWLDRKKIYVRV